MEKPEIYRYLNYREYLRDFADSKRNGVRVFSLRQFSRKAGISTGNYLAKIIREERNLGPRQLDRFVLALGLRRRESEYFRTMVALNHSQGTESKLEHLEKLDRLRRAQRKLKLERDDEFFRHWYFAAIFELASCRDFKSDPEWISRSLRGRVKPEEARLALEFLLSKGYLRVRKAGGYEQKPVSVVSSQFERNLYLRLTHRKMSEFAIEALDLPMEDRTFQGVYLALRRDQMPQLKQRLAQMAEELVRDFGEAKDAEAVFRFNLQLFPLTEFSGDNAKIPGRGQA